MRALLLTASLILMLPAHGQEVFEPDSRAALQSYANQAARHAMGQGEAPSTIDVDRILTLPQRQAFDEMIRLAVADAQTPEIVVDEALADEPPPPAVDYPPFRCVVRDTDGTVMVDARVERFDEDQADKLEACDETATSEILGAEAIELTSTGLNDDALSPVESSVQVLASSTASRVSLKFDLSSSPLDAADGVFWSRSLVLSAPVDKNDSEGRSDLVGLEGLANDFELEYNIARVRTVPLGKLAPDEADWAVLAEMPKACLTLGISMDSCTYTNIVREASRQRNAALQERFSVPGRAWFQGLTLKAGYDDFSFFDADTLAKRTQDEVPWSVGGFLGQLRGKSYYAFGADYQREYEGGRPTVACPQDGEEDGPFTTCVNGALTPPASSEQRLVWAEGRWLIRGKGVGAKVTHDLKSSDWDVAVPVYLFPDKEGVLTSGLRLGWSTEDHFSAGIFVGVPFRMNPH